MLPLHLAFAGAPGFAVILLMAFMLSQWPLAMVLSQTGRLDLAYGLSALVFAGFLTGFAAVSGGPASAALFWLVLVPLEAAQAACRRMVSLSALVCLGAVALLFMVPLPEPMPGSLAPLTVVLAACGAAVYAAVLAGRLVSDVRRSRKVMEERHGAAQLLSAHSNEAVLVYRPDGSMGLLGGSLDPMLDVPARQLKGDWLLQRLHVTDRPAYLMALADVRETGGPKVMNLRLRRGASEPGTPGHADYVWLRVTLRRAADPGTKDCVVLTLSDRSREHAENEALTSALGTARLETTAQSRDLARFGADLRGPLKQIIDYAAILKSRDGSGLATGASSSEAYAERIEETGQQLLEMVDTVLSAADMDSGARTANVVPFDMPTCLSGTLAELQDAAARAGITLAAAIETGLPVYAGDQEACRQMLKCLVLAAAKATQCETELTLSAKARPGHILVEMSGDPWLVLNAGPARHFITLAEKLAQLQGARLKISAVRDRCERVSVSFPLQSSHTDGRTSDRLETNNTGQLQNIA